MRVLITLSLLALATPAAAATYRCPTEEGGVEYTDRPCEDGEEVRLPEVSTFESPSPAATRQAAEAAAAGAAAPEEAEEELGYDRLQITAPTPEKVFWNTGGNLVVRLEVVPELRDGHEIQVYLDGQAIAGGPSRRLVYQLSEVWPIEHNVRFEVFAADGSLVGSSDTVVFYVRQHTRD